MSPCLTLVNCSTIAGSDPFTKGGLHVKLNQSSWPIIRTGWGLSCSPANSETELRLLSQGALSPRAAFLMQIWCIWKAGEDLREKSTAYSLLFCLFKCKTSSLQFRNVISVKILGKEGVLDSRRSKLLNKPFFLF